MFKAKATFILGVLLIPFLIQAQELIDKINKDLLEKRWTAQWIQHPTASASAYGVFHFRKTFSLEAVPDEFIVHVSADNRYRLFVNGEAVCFGPARGDQLHWYYETVDISNQLQTGKNVLAAIVWNAGDERPLAQITYQTAFILQGNTAAQRLVDTNDGWKVMQNDGYKPIRVDHTMIHGYYAAGAMDRVDGALFPWNWELPEYDDAEWEAATNIGFGGQGVPSRYTQYSAMSAWQLIPRDIPMMEERLQRIANVIRHAGPANGHDFLKGQATTVFAPNTETKILLDLGHLTTAYPEIQLSGGKGAEVKITYAEALYDDQGLKGNRDITEGKQILGLYDLFKPDGRDHATYRPLWYRTYRFVELSIKTADAPLEIHDFYGLFSAYPFEEKATFKTGEKILDQIWDRGWRTARLCAMETYMDCPYYEQLQYVGDTRIQALISLYVSGDDRLMKKSIRQFDQSRFFEGLTMSRHPTYIPQVTPGYSLIFILMVHDFMMYREDKAFVREMVPGIESVLSWFERKTDDTGLLGLLPWVNYMDAAEGFISGTPPYQHEGHSAQISLLFAYTTLRAAEIFDYLGNSDKAKYYRKRYQSIIENVSEQCYDADRGLLAETPAKKIFTQHTNILAVLTDAVEKDQQLGIMTKVLEDTSLTRVEIYFQFYLFEALKKVGLADGYLDLLDDWYVMIDQGLSTFAEHRYEARSDCHAWSSHPMHGFLAIVCGVRSSEVEFRKVSIQPSIGKLKSIEATIPHPLGSIKIQYESKSEAQLTGVIELPKGLSGDFLWNGYHLELKEGRNNLKVR